MRNIFIAPFISLFCVCISCNNSSTPSSGEVGNSEAQKNIEAWHTVSMAFSTGNTDLLDNVIADEYLDHTPRGDFKGRDSVKSNLVRMRSTFRDVKMKIIKELADDEYGFFWMQFNGSKADATGTAFLPFEMTSIQAVKFKNGQAVEHWEYVDPRMFQQRGLEKRDSSNRKN